MSSRVDHERGCVVITAPGGEPGYEVGRIFWPPGMRPSWDFFDDLLAAGSDAQRVERQTSILPALQI